MLSHDHPRFSDPSYRPFECPCGTITAEPGPRPIYCAGCSDTEVLACGQVCAECRNSGPGDWVRFNDYLAMRRLAETAVIRG